jgi:hypothetical protein
MAPGGNEMLDEDDIFAAGVQVADDDDALLAHFLPILP